MAASPTILIIDEDLNSRVETRRALQRSKLEIVGEVGFGTEAVSFAHDKKPDVIVMAVEEPVTRALDTAEALGNVLPDTPVIFYSSLGEPEAVRRAVLAGARDYLVKPLQAAATKEAINRALDFEEKRRLRQAGQLTTTSVRGTVVTVAGAKGGIGKSVIAVNLALALREQTQSRVVIVDGDTQFGDVATMLDVVATTTATQLLRDLDSLERNGIEAYLTQGTNGVMLLAGPTEDINVWEEAPKDAGARIVDLLSTSYDFIVVDTSGSMDSFVRALMDRSTVVLLVTSGEVSSVRDTKSALARMKAWEVPEERIKVVLNRGARADGFQLGDLEESLGRKVFWELPRDNDVPRSVQVGRPIILEKPTGAAARHISSLASAIGGNVRANGQKPASAPDGLWPFGRKQVKA